MPGWDGCWYWEGHMAKPCLSCWIRSPSCTRVSVWVPAQLPELQLCVGQHLRPLLQARGALKLPSFHPPLPGPWQRCSRLLFGLRCHLQASEMGWGGLWHSEKAMPEQELLGKKPPFPLP